MRRIWLVLGAVAAAGCAGTSGADDTASVDDAPAFEVVDPVELAPPGDDVVLELLVDGAPAGWTLADLESVELVRMSTHEPLVDAPTVFEGVRLSRLFGAVGVDASATFEMTTLNDDAFELAIQEALDADGLLATRERGTPIPVEAGGPVRVVFGDGSELATEERLDAWVRSIARIEVGEAPGVRGLRLQVPQVGAG